MHSIFNYPLLALLTFLITAHANAQECSKYYSVVPGTKCELTSYDKNGTVKSVTTNEVIAFSNDKGTVRTTIFDF